MNAQSLFTVPIKTIKIICPQDSEYNDRIIIPENLRKINLAMLHQGHQANSKMEMASETFWWPGIFKDIRTKVENCTSCRMSGKNLETQIPSTEKNYLEILTEPNQEIQLDFAGPINSKSWDTLYILVAVDRFSRWPTAKTCSRTDTKTVLQILKELYTEKGTPKSIRTDNATCFKSDEFKSYCKQEYIHRIRSTPNLRTGTGLVERTIRTIKDLIRANLQDGLSFSHSLMTAIKSIRMTPNNHLKLTPFELHKGRKPRTTITNASNQNNCLLSNWEKLTNKFVSAQPQELQVYTIKVSDGGLVDYLVMNAKRRTKSVSEQFAPYQFYERETKPDAMKKRFKTEKSPTAVTETRHTVKTDNGKILHEKLISNPFSFQP